MNSMKVFNSKAAVEEYMSMHSLAYSTPDTIIKKFGFWLGEMVEIDCKLDADRCPNDDKMHPRHKVPRLMLFIEERDEPYKVESEGFKPTGAIASYFEAVKIEKRYCHECGNELSYDARFCAECGAKQE